MMRKNSPQQAGVHSAQAIHLAGSPVVSVSALVVVVVVVSLVQGVLLANAQYSGTICDTARLLRCQQDIVRDVQTGSINAASIQYNIGGPPYSPKQLQQLSSSSSQSTCRLVRSNLDCLLNTTPACYDQGIQAARNTDVILRAKRFLEQNNCNEPDTTWQTTYCYRSPDIKACEDRYSFSNNEFSTISLSNITACLSYQAFKHCIDTYSRFNCKVHEMDMINEYLIDRASDLAWRCPQNASALSSYQLSNNPSGTILSPYSSFSVYDQRPVPIPTYVGSHSANLGGYGGAGNREQLWERFRNPIDDPRFAQGISRYPTYGGSGEVLDRLVAGNVFEVDSSDCPIKAAPYARECERTLETQKQQASDSRDGNELQRRLCCSLFQYRDCVSRVVLDRCTDATPTAVELLMGLRKHEMTLTCRGFNMAICSGSTTSKLINLQMLVIIFLVSIVTMRQSVKVQSYRE